LPILREGLTMGNFVPELKDQRDVFGWAKRLVVFLRSTILRGGRGILVQQTDSGTTVSLGNHAADHAPGGKDEVGFQSLEIKGGTPEKTITLDPAAADFLAARILAVAESGNATAWRTLLDLVDGLSGFAAGKVLKVNSGATALEWGAGGAAANTVLESLSTGFQTGKLVIASATAHELMGTLIGINTHGAAYQGYGDSDLSTDARVAAIADARFNAVSGIGGLGSIGQVAVFYDDKLIEGANFGVLFTTHTASITGLGGGLWLFCYNGTTDEWSYQSALGFLQEVSGFGGNKVLSVSSDESALNWIENSSLPAGAAGDVLYYNGAAWVVLAKPASDMFLKNTSSGGVSWAGVNALPTGTVGQVLYHNGSAWVVLAKPSSDMFLKNTSSGGVQWSAAAGAQSSGGNGVSLVTSDGKIKTIFGY
jgi:hypothetical protein